MPPVYGLAVEYTTHGLPAEQFATPLNAMYRRFLDKGVQVFFTYAPRNSQALSDNSTPEARAELDQSLRQNLCVPVLGTVEDFPLAGPLSLRHRQSPFHRGGNSAHPGRC